MSSIYRSKSSVLSRTTSFAIAIVVALSAFGYALYKAVFVDPSLGSWGLAFLTGCAILFYACAIRYMDHVAQPDEESLRKNVQGLRQDIERLRREVQEFPDAAEDNEPCSDDRHLIP